MKNMAMVMTTKVWLRARRAIAPSGMEMAPAISPQMGSKKSGPKSLLTCQSWQMMASAYAPMPKNTAWPRAM